MQQKPLTPPTVPTLLVVLAKSDGVCYFARGSHVVECAHLMPAHPDHSDVAWFTPADNEPDPTYVFEQRFVAYVAAVVTAIVHTTGARRMFIYGDRLAGTELIKRLPLPIRDHARCVVGDGDHPPRAGVAERVREMLLTTIVPHQPTPFGAAQVS